MKRVKFYGNERVGLPDMQDSAGALLAIDNLLRQARITVLPDGKNTGGAATSARIFSGFEYSVPGGLGVGNTFILTAGRGIFPIYDNQELKFGLILGDFSPATKTLDFSAVSPGTYAVYVRYIYQQTDSENRIFWNATTAAEEVSNLTTRETGYWDATFKLSTEGPPGNGEYVKIYEVEITAGPVVNTVDDYRHLYFEGDAYAAAFTQEWGDGANDRNADRAAYPIEDWHQFAQFLRRQLKEIIDPTLNYAHAKLPDIDLKTTKDTFDTIAATTGTANVGAATQSVTKPSDGVGIISPASTTYANGTVFSALTEILTYLANGLYRGGDNTIQARDDNTTTNLLRLLTNNKDIAPFLFANLASSTRKQYVEMDKFGNLLTGRGFDDSWIYNIPARVTDEYWELQTSSGTGGTADVYSLNGSIRLRALSDTTNALVGCELFLNDTGNCTLKPCPELVGFGELSALVAFTPYQISTPDLAQFIIRVKGDANNYIEFTFDILNNTLDVDIWGDGSGTIRSQSYSSGVKVQITDGQPLALRFKVFRNGSVDALSFAETATGIDQTISLPVDGFFKTSLDYYFSLNAYGQHATLSGHGIEVRQSKFQIRNSLDSIYNV